MGVQGLRKLIERFAPDAIRTNVSFTELRGSIFVMDASLRIFKWSLVQNGRVADDGTTLNHIHGAFAMTDCLRKAGITTVYIFDGKPPAEKDATVNARNAARDTGASKSPDTRVWDETRELLDLLGVSHFTAKGEADPAVAASTLIESEHTIYAATDDLDALAFGAKYVVLDINCIKETVTIITLADVLEGLGISFASFVDMCILLGCDYTSERVKGIGPVSAVKLIRQYGNIEDVLNETETMSPDGFTWYSARRVFADLPDIPEDLIREPDMGIPFTIPLREWLIDKCGTLNTRMKRILK